MFEKEANGSVTFCRSDEADTLKQAKHEQTVSTLPKSSRGKGVHVLLEIGLECAELIVERVSNEGSLKSVVRDGGTVVDLQVAVFRCIREII